MVIPIIHSKMTAKTVTLQKRLGHISLDFITKAGFYRLTLDLTKADLSFYKLIMLNLRMGSYDGYEF
jgi:hypothetical protein